MSAIVVFLYVLLGVGAQALTLNTAAVSSAERQQEARQCRRVGEICKPRRSCCSGLKCKRSTCVVSDIIAHPTHVIIAHPTNQVMDLWNPEPDSSFDEWLYYNGVQPLDTISNEWKVWLMDHEFAPALYFDGFPTFEDTLHDNRPLDDVFHPCMAPSADAADDDQGTCNEGLMCKRVMAWGNLRFCFPDIDHIIPGSQYAAWISPDSYPNHISDEWQVWLGEHNLIPSWTDSSGSGYAFNHAHSPCIGGYTAEDGQGSCEDENSMCLGVETWGGARFCFPDGWACSFTHLHMTRPDGQLCSCWDQCSPN